MITSYALAVEILNRCIKDGASFRKGRFTKRVIIALDGEDSIFFNEDEFPEYVNKLSIQRASTISDSRNQRLDAFLNEDNKALKEMVKKEIKENVNINKLNLVMNIISSNLNIDLTVKEYPEKDIDRTVLSYCRFLEFSISNGTNTQSGDNFNRSADKIMQLLDEKLNSPNKKDRDRERKDIESKIIFVSVFVLALIIIILVSKNVNEPEAEKSDTFEPVSESQTSESMPNLKEYELPVTAGWGPDREKFSTLVLPDFVTFNSIENANYKDYFQGNELNFCLIKKKNSDDEWSNEVTFQAGNDYNVYCFFHNNSAKTTAKDVKMKANIPAQLEKGEVGKINMSITSSNSTPETVWDSVIGRAETLIGLRVTSAEATITTSGNANGMKLDDKFYSEGTNIGYDSLDGVIPTDKFGYVTFTIRAVLPDYTIKIRASKHGKEDWQPTMDMQNDSLIDFQIEFENNGDIFLEDVMVRIELPEEIIYDIGSTEIANSTSKFGFTKISDGITTIGYNIGNYNPGEKAFIKFTGKTVTRESTSRGDLLTVKAFGNSQNIEKDALMHIALDK